MAPGKVLINAENSQTECFFKPCHSEVQTTIELKAYEKITKANLDPQLYICRLHGVVMNDNGSIAGLLLTYIDHEYGTLARCVYPFDIDDEVPASVRAKWASQIEAPVTALHEAGVVWGDVN